MIGSNRRVSPSWFYNTPSLCSGEILGDVNEQFPIFISKIITMFNKIPCRIVYPSKGGPIPYTLCSQSLLMPLEERRITPFTRSKSRVRFEGNSGGKGNDVIQSRTESPVYPSPILIPNVISEEFHKVLISPCRERLSISSWVQKVRHLLFCTSNMSDRFGFFLLSPSRGCHSGECHLGTSETETLEL